MQRTLAKRIGKFLAVGAAACLLTVAAHRKAVAAQVTCAVNLIEYSHAELIVQCNSLNYYGVNYSTPAGCATGAQVMDTLKAWTSLSQAALLAGKNMQIYYETCNGVRFITRLDLIK